MFEVPVNDLPPCIRNVGNDHAAVHCESGECAAIRHARRLPCHRRKLKRRHHLFLQGDPQRHVYYVATGAIRLYALLENGRRQIVDFKLPGDFILFDHEPKYRFNAQAISATEVRSFPLASFRAAAGDDAAFMLKLYAAVSAELARTRNLMLISGPRNAEGCLAALLLDLADRAPPLEAVRGFVALPMLRSDIADFVGLSHETVSRVLSQFKKIGLIDLRGRSGLKLVDRPALAVLANCTVGGRRPETVARAPHLLAH
jgi:CRP-like cAMP-binding protein